MYYLYHSFLIFLLVFVVVVSVSCASLPFFFHIFANLMFLFGKHGILDKIKLFVILLGRLGILHRQ